jgi:hypothetical protein
MLEDKEKEAQVVRAAEEKRKEIEALQERCTTALDLISEWANKFFVLNQKVQQQESEMKRLKMLERYYNKYG